MVTFPSIELCPTRILDACQGGHQKGDPGLSATSRYAGRETMEAKLACVRAVRLPAG